ncbi:MAG: DUF2608 domain-containing protein [Holosporaceae bacterium]|nr:DUF2608 domain-containing protein [Holosporaceae bacterium]
MENRIVTAGTIDVLEHELKNANRDILVVFDCNGVLTANSDQIMNNCHRKIFKTLFQKHISDKSGMVEFLSCMVSATPDRPVNERMPTIIDDLQRRNVKVVVLTGLGANPFGKIKDPKKWRSDTLNDLGYHFENSWMSLGEKIFDDQSVYFKGIILCGGNAKSQCLKNFIEYANIKPKKIMFIDDSLKNLSDVSDFCRSRDISFVGINYLEADHLNSKRPFSEKRAEFQFKTFEENGVWLSDDEAEEKMSKK